MRKPLIFLSLFGMLAAVEPKNPTGTRITDLTSLGPMTATPIRLGATNQSARLTSGLWRKFIVTTNRETIWTLPIRGEYHDIIVLRRMTNSVIAIEMAGRIDEAWTNVYEGPVCGIIADPVFIVGTGSTNVTLKGGTAWIERGGTTKWFPTWWKE